MFLPCPLVCEHPAYTQTPSASFSLLPGQKAAWGFFGYQELGPSKAHGSPAELRSQTDLLCGAGSHRPSRGFTTAPRPRSGPRSQLRRCSDAPACLSFPPCICLIWADDEFSRQDPSPLMRRGRSWHKQGQNYSPKVQP